MGKGRKSAEVPQRSREITAWHESGHALAALLLPDVADPVQVTIIPRGISGGATWYGVSDETFKTGAQARAELVVALAGRAAEEILLDGDFTQGASNDIAKATELAQTMVASWGMSSLGLAAVGPEHAGSALVERVHAEADALMTDALARARALLAAHRPLLEVVVAESSPRRRSTSTGAGTCGPPWSPGPWRAPQSTGSGGRASPTPKMPGGGMVAWAPRSVPLLTCLLRFVRRAPHRLDRHPSRPTPAGRGRERRRR